MKRKAVMYVAQFADPGSYRKEQWRRVLGHDDECVAFEALLDEAGLRGGIDYLPVRAHEGEPLLDDVGGVDAIVLGGSFASVSDGYVWQLRLAEWLRGIRSCSKPLLGICGGHQLMSYVLGAPVAKIKAGPEVGSLPVTLTPEGRRHHLFDGFDTGSRFYFGNSDHVVAPEPGAVVLATRPNLPAAAVDHGGGWMSVQFHPEMTCDRMATSWLSIDPKRATEYSFLVGCERLVLNFLRGSGIAA